MSQLLLTAKDAHDNINNNNLGDFFPLSRVEAVPDPRSVHQHDDDSRIRGTLDSPSQSTSLRKMGVTNFETSKSVVWRTVPSTTHSTTAAAAIQHDNNNRGRVAKIEEGLDNSVGPEAKVRINKILGDVNSLSDVEKLLLYLKLPTGSGTGEDAIKQLSNSSLHTSNRVQQSQAFTWIKSHLEEDQEICLPKQEVFEEYRSYCENHGLKCLSTADFGKVMKCVFPNIKPRRLGQRGQSKYCYSGLRKKLEIPPPTLPELEISSTHNEREESAPQDDLFAASCQLVCEWAQKLLGKSFTDLRELAEFLLGNLYVNSKSMSAFTVIAAMQESGGNIAKGNMPQLFCSPPGGNKHRETQLQLQRKLQERELLKEQKKKLQQQKCEIEREQAESRAGSSSERELGTPSILHSRYPERELETPSISLGRLSTTPCDDISSPARSSVSCSPSRTPTRADSVESRRTASETEFVSPVAIRDTYRRRNSQGASEKERRRREKVSSHMSSPLFEAARNLLEGTKNLDRQLFASDDESSEKHSKDSLGNKSHWEGTRDEGKSICEESRKGSSSSLPECMDTSVSTATSSSYSKHLLNLVPGSCSPVFDNNLSNNSQSDSNLDNRLPQTSLKVPLGPSRSAFVPFPQRVVVSQTQAALISNTIPASASIISPISSAADTTSATLQKSRGLARLLMSKPKKDVGVLEKHSHGQLAQIISSNLTAVNSSNSASLNVSRSVHQAVQSSSVVSSTVPMTVPSQDTPRSVQPIVSEITSHVISRPIQPVLHPLRDYTATAHTSLSRPEGSVMEQASSSKFVSHIMDQNSISEKDHPTTNQSTISQKDGPIPIQPAIASSPLTVEVNNNQRQDQPQTPISSPSVENNPGAVSPSTPRRQKTRFTPIRPKAPAPRTVSSMLREQRGPPISLEGSSFGSKPVSEILKEKRERETLLLPLSPAAGTLTPCIPGVQLSPKLTIPAQMPIIQPVLARSAEMQSANSLSAGKKTGEVFIIMGASPTAGTANTVVPVKAKRSNTISIPILQKDISLQLKQGKTESVPLRSKHSQNSRISDKTASHQQLNQSIQFTIDSQDNMASQAVNRMETEEHISGGESSTSKRKRKSPGSVKDPFPACGTEVTNGVKSSPAEVIIASHDSADSLSDSADENNPKRSKSCLPNLEHHDSAMSDSSEERICPDITSLESDALVDMPLSAAELATSLGPEAGTYESISSKAAVKTASVGVTSHSMKLSHKLMRQSMQLDKRIDIFLKQRSSKPKPTKVQQVEPNNKSMRSPVDDMVVMTSLYSTSGKHRSANRTASDTKLNIKPCISQEKARSTVHRGVVQTSNSFVVKKPLASKGGSRDHFLLKLLTGESSTSPQAPSLARPTSITKDISAPPNIDSQSKTLSSLRLVQEQRPHLSENSGFLDDLTSILNKSDSVPQDMDTSSDSELPTEVADFITESMEKRSNSGFLPGNNSSFISLQIGDFQQLNLDNFQSSTLQHSSDLSAEILSSQIPSYQRNLQDSLFTVPSVPPSGREARQRRNTPVQRSVSVPVLPMNVTGQTSTALSSTEKHEKMVESTESLVSIGSISNVCQPVLQRMNSSERHGAQTPISDAGYHSFDSSPVPSSTPLPICIPQPPITEGNVSLEPKQHTIGSSQPQSPLQLPSPKAQQQCARSTPLSVLSPHITAINSANTSPVSSVSTQKGFMPIGGSSSFQVDSTLINPIKPTVTLAANGVFSSQIYSPKTQDTTPSVQENQSLSIKNPDPLSRRSNQNSPMRSPPSYQDAIQSLQRQTPTLLQQNENNLGQTAVADSSSVLQELADVKEPDSVNSSDQILTEGSMLKSGISPSVFPFSYQLSLLRSKSSEPENVQEEEGNEHKRAESNLSSPMSGSTCSEYSALAFQGSSETEQVEFQNVATLIKHYHASSRQQVESKKPAVLLPQDILVQLQEQNQRPNSQQSPNIITRSKQHFDLPDARYMGSTPNVDVRNLISERQGIGPGKTKLKTVEETSRMAPNPENQALDIRSLLEVKLVRSGSSQQTAVVQEDGAFLARRNLSQILGGSALGEDDLQTTLEDLKSLDTQYFNSIPINPGMEQTIPEDIRDLRPIDLNNPDSVSLETKEDSL